MEDGFNPGADNTVGTATCTIANSPATMATYDVTNVNVTCTTKTFTIGGSVAKLAGTGISPLFPLWQRDTHALAREMIDGGLRATLTCVDPKQLDRGFAGRSFDRTLLGHLPRAVDPCGENGEFHTFVSAGPMFAAPLAVSAGAVVARDGFVFADLTLA